jgi:hypothetical protein
MLAAGEAEEALVLGLGPDRGYALVMKAATAEQTP